MPGSCSYFTCKVGFENSISRLRVITMDIFWDIGNALDFQARDPWFESGCLQQFVSSFFSSFWPFTVPSPFIKTLNIKLLKHANNVINNRIYLIITLFSLNPSLFACNPYGRWLFLKSGFYIPVFCEQYRHYFCLDLVDFWVCCSWDYKLSKSSLIFSIRYQDHANDHDHHYHNDDKHLSITFSFLWIR